MKDSDIRKMRSKRRTSWKKILFFVIILGCIAFCGVMAGFYFSVQNNLPNVGQNITPDASSRIYDCKGRLISTVHAEQNRIPVPISDVPKNLQDAFIAAEDTRFYQHHGIDPRGIGRAFWNNVITHNATGQGGSTITQQLARNAFLTQDQTIKRKLMEVILALEIEKRYTKQQILEMYMNQIYFGQGCYGIQTASRVYFNKDVKDLSLAQCALLAGLPNSPNYYSPFRSVEAAKSRQAIVLDQMAKYGYITKAEADKAKTDDLHLAKPKKDLGTESTGSYFVSYVIQQISDKYDSEAIYKEGLQIYTTLDLDMQKEAEQAIRTDLPKGSKDSKGLTQPQGALLSLEVGTGHIKAMVGGRGEDHFNRAVQMVRQPGSSFKPFVYLTAFENHFSPSDMLSNEKKTYAGGWSPKNYDGESGGNVSVTTALVDSMNIPTIDLANRVGMRKVLKTAEDCGITTIVKDGKYSDDNLAASIGGLTKGVTLYDMATAYSVFANDGKLIKPNCIVKVVDRNGNTLEDHEDNPEGKQVVDKEAVYTLTGLLEQVISGGTGGNAYIGRTAAGKTGTTDDEHDAWFIGYTPELVTAVWIGDDNSTNAGYTGGTIPAAIWRDYMKEALSGYSAKSFNVPESVRQKVQQSQAKEEEKPKKDDSSSKKNAGKKEPAKPANDASNNGTDSDSGKILDQVSGKR